MQHVVRGKHHKGGWQAREVGLLARRGTKVADLSVTVEILSAEPDERIEAAAKEF